MSSSESDDGVDLFTAACEGDIKQIQNLLDEGYADVNLVDENGMTALLYASKHGKRKVVTFLLRRGADVEAENEAGESALILASQKGFPDVARVLLENDAEVDSRDKCQWTALHWAAYKGFAKVVKLLLDNDAEDNAQIDAVHVALKREVNVHLNGSTALHLACARGHVNVINTLLEYNENANQKTKSLGWTTLHVATAHNQMEAVKALLAGVNDLKVNQKDKSGQTALTIACKEGYIGVVRLLLKAHNVKPTIKDKDQKTAFHFASENGHREVLVKLLDLVETSSLIDAKDKSGWTALHFASAENKYDEAELLLAEGAKVNVVDQDGETPLHLASKYHNSRIVALLLRKRSSSNKKNKAGQTPLDVCIQRAHEGKTRRVLRTIFALVSNEADCVNFPVTGSHRAAKKLAIVQFCLGSWLNERKQGGRRLTPIPSVQVLQEGIHAVKRSFKVDDSRNVGEDVNGKEDPEQSMSMGELSAVSQSHRESDNQDILQEQAESNQKPNEAADVVEAVSPYASRDVKISEHQDHPAWFISRDSVKKTSQNAFACGSFGSVYRAEWENSDVVMKEIKNLPQIEKDRFMDEVNLWCKLNHPNVVKLYGANHESEPFFIVSSYASNGELVPYLQREKNAGRDVTWRKLKEVAAGLNYLHSQKFVHGDLKGDNILVGMDGTAMLTDFGLSFSESGSYSVVRDKRHDLGAMAWRAPEFANLTIEKPTYKSDVYSLGMCIIEAVTGRNPWSERANNHEIRKCLKIGEIKVTKPVGMTDVQWELVEKMIAPSPQDRPELSEVIAKLNEFATEEENAENRQQCPYD